jgi:riboflavin transporter FmnP
MKSAASIWMIAIPELLRHSSRETWNIFHDRRAFALSTIASISVRGVATLLFNFYFALPVFFGMSADQILSFFTNPRSQSFVGNSLGIIGAAAFTVEIVFWNTIQGLIDAYVSFAAVLVTARRLFGRHT